MSKIKSEFNAQTTMLDTDTLDFVRSGHNYKITWANFMAFILASISEPSILNKDEDYTVGANDDTILLDGTSNTVTALLLTASGRSGKKYTFKCIDDTNACTIDGAASETIDGATTKLLTLNVPVTIQSDGTEWWIV
jgi:hypothetical protein